MINEIRDIVRSKIVHILKVTSGSFSVISFFSLLIIGGLQYSQNTQKEDVKYLNDIITSQYEDISQYKNYLLEAHKICELGSKLSEVQKKKINYYSNLDFYIKQMILFRGKSISSLNSLHNVFGKQTILPLREIINYEAGNISIPEYYCKGKLMNDRLLDQQEQTSIDTLFTVAPELRARISELKR